MSKLLQFNQWRVSVKDKLEAIGYSVSFFDGPPCDNKSMRLDFKSNRIEGSMMAWEHGDIDFEAYDAEKDEFIFAEKMNDDNHTVKIVCDTYLAAIVGDYEAKGPKSV